MEKLQSIVDRFDINGHATQIAPMGNGLINDTYRVTTSTDHQYVLQRINHNIFTDVELLQSNIEKVTAHIRHRLQAEGVEDIDRRVLRFIPLKSSGKTYYFDGESYWRLMVMITDAVTHEAVDAEHAEAAGEAFGHFESMLTDIADQLGESIPRFHDMELRAEQLEQAVAADPVGRLESVRKLVDWLLARRDEMCRAEELHRQGLLPKRVCHCDTKVNNMLYDRQGNVLCVIDLDTVMPAYIFSDYGDFLRTGANTAAEDEKDLSKVQFRMDIFEAFTRGYLRGAGSFLTPLEIEMLPFAVALFPYMQAVRFLTDYINGDTYYKTAYPDHNLIRTLNQVHLLKSIDANTPRLHAFIASLPH